MTLDNILVCLCIICFITLIYVLRIWHYFQEHTEHEPFLTGEDKLIYDMWLKPMVGNIKKIQKDLSREIKK